MYFELNKSFTLQKFFSIKFLTVPCEVQKYSLAKAREVNKPHFDILARGQVGFFALRAFVHFIHLYFIVAGNLLS